MTAQFDAAFNYNDLNSLNSLKSGARKDDPEAVRAVAQQFESMFMQLILKSMRDASDVLASDIGNGYQTKFYRDMHDQQLSLEMSKQGGFGLADVIYEQLTREPGARPNGLNRANGFDLQDSIRPMQPASPDYLTNEPKPSDAKVEAKPTEDLASFQAGDPKSFIESIQPVAEQAAAILGVSDKVLIAQAALETGWGQALMKKTNGQPAYNFFGIKADSRWQGEQVAHITHEFIDGQKLTLKEPFRAYSSPEESFNDYVAFISESPRYQQALENANNPEKYLEGLQNAGYATDPSYADKIIRIMNSDWFEAS